MMFFFPLFLLCSLFILYIIVKNDFTFLRKNISQKFCFDVMLTSLLGFFLGGRLLYIIGGFHGELLNPITFLHFFRYPGIVFLGGVLGFAFILFLFFRKKKVIYHAFDIYALSLYPLFLFAFLFLSFKNNFLYFNVFLLVLSLLFLGIGIYSYKNYLLKDGSIALLFLCVVSIFTVVNEFSNNNARIFQLFTSLQIVSIIIFIFASLALLIRESLIPSRRK